MTTDTMCERKSQSQSRSKIRSAMASSQTSTHLHTRTPALHKERERASQITRAKQRCKSTAVNFWSIQQVSVELLVFKTNHVTVSVRQGRSLLQYSQCGLACRCLSLLRSSCSNPNSIVRDLGYGRRNSKQLPTTVSCLSSGQAKL